MSGLDNAMNQYGAEADVERGEMPISNSGIKKAENVNRSLHNTKAIREFRQNEFTH